MKLSANYSIIAFNEQEASIKIKELLENRILSELNEIYFNYSYNIQICKIYNNECDIFVYFNIPGIEIRENSKEHKLLEEIFETDIDLYI